MKRKDLALLPENDSKVAILSEKLYNKKEIMLG